MHKPIFKEVDLGKVANPLNLNQFVLQSNGLNVILCERHDAPVITTYVIYRVGSRNEAVGYTGATHFLEHMMFKGTVEHDPLKKTGLDDLLKPVGGYNNASTSFDRTSYFEVVPAGNLDACLEFEADRMHNLLLRQSDRTSEMTVVRNELEGTLDDPQEVLQTNVYATAFQAHPYHHPTIGWRSDVEKVPLTRLRKFYEDYYWPDNATIVVIGDFSSADALAKIGKYFGHLKPSPHKFPDVYTVEPPQEGERRFTVQRGSEMPRLMAAFHIPNAMHNDAYALSVIESILGSSDKQSSRLYKTLIDSGLAADVQAAATNLRDPGLFYVSATASPDVNLDQIEKPLLDELQKLTTEPVSRAELSRAKRSIVKRLRLAGTDPIGLGDELTEVVSCANLKWWLAYPNNIEKVTAADVLAVAKRYFTQRNRTVGYYLPRETVKTQVVKVHPHEEETAPLVPFAETTIFNPPLRGAAATPAKKTFADRVMTKVLKNGLTVSVLPIRGLGTVSISGRSIAGAVARSRDKTLVPELVADMLTRGSTNCTKEMLSRKLEDMGTTVSFSTDDFFLSFDSDVTREDFPQFCRLISDAICHPKFSETELTKAKDQLQSSLKDRLSDTSEQAQNIFSRTAYKPDSVYYNKSFENQITELGTISADDLRDFHKSFLSPPNTVLCIVGDIDANDAIRVIDESFRDWHGGSRFKLPTKQDIAPRSKSETVAVPLADKENTAVMIGKPIATSIETPDFFATTIGNAALGFDAFASRLAPVRDRYGLSYYISSSISNPAQKFSPWLISFTVNPENLNKAITLVKKIAADYVAGGITAKELKEEKTHLAGTYVVSLRSQKQIAEKLSEYELLSLGPQFIDDFAKNLQAVKIADVNASIARYFRLNDAITAISGTLKSDKK